MSTTNVSRLPGIPFQYHSAYDVRYRNAAISMDSDDMSFLDNEDEDEDEDYNVEEYSERSTYLSNSESYNYKLQKPSYESIEFRKSPKLKDRSNEEYSERSTYLSSSTITNEGYSYNRLQKPSTESFGLPRSPKLNAFDNQSGLLTPKSNRGGLLTPRSDRYQIPSPISSAGEDERFTKRQSRVLPPTPEERSPSPKKKQKRYFSLGKSFSSLISNTRPKFLSASNKRGEEKQLQIIHDNPQLYVSDSRTTDDDDPSEIALPVLTPSSPISRKFPESYFPEDFGKDDDQPEEVNVAGSTIDELYNLVLIMQKGYWGMAKEIKELKLEIQKLKGEEIDENEKDISGRLRSVKSFTRQYGDDGKWFHNE